MLQWEYTRSAGLHTANLTDRVLNEYGQDGWELVTILPAADVRPGLYFAYFKRPRPVLNTKPAAPLAAYATK